MKRIYRNPLKVFPALGRSEALSATHDAILHEAGCSGAKGARSIQSLFSNEATPADDFARCC